MKFHMVYRISEHTLPLLGYVVRWKYCVKLTGVKTLKGRQSRYEDVGRDKVAYFFWQGKDSSLNEKGTAALMTVELDSDKGPQVPSHLLVPNETRTGNQSGQSKRRKLPRANQKSKYEHVGKLQARENANERVATGF